jgi:uncharacterized glyoxalase superfamily protein PhnB
MPVLSQIIPVLRSFDEARTRDFYLNFLGFEHVFEHRFEDWAPLYMGVRHGDCVIHLSEHYGDGTPGTTLRILVDDVAAYAAELRAKKHGNSRPGEPHETPWGTREIGIKDPSSNTLIFYSRIPGSAGA